jgi:hypothetical protein
MRRPARWHVGPPSLARHAGLWAITARGPHPGRGKMPQTVTGTGETETDALRDLDERLRGVPRDEGRLDELRRRARLAYVQGAEDRSLRELGRGLTTAEFARVIGRFPDNG